MTQEQSKDMMPEKTQDKPVRAYDVVVKNETQPEGGDFARIHVGLNGMTLEPDQFLAFCEWANARFGKVEISVADTLQRFNLMFEEGYDQHQAWEYARRAGDMWLMRNKKALMRIENLEIVRWDQSLRDPRFAHGFEKFCRIYKSWPEFRTAFDDAIRAFWERNAAVKEAYTEERYDDFYEYACEFLLEELAVFYFQCRTKAVDAYAGSWAGPIFHVLRSNPEPFYDAFRRDWLQVDFVKNKGFSPTDSQRGDSGRLAA